MLTTPDDVGQPGVVNADIKPLRRFSAERDANRRVAHGDVSVVQRRDTEGLVGPGVLIVADAQTCHVDQADDGGDDEIVVNVQGDEPLIEPELIDACADLLAERADCVMSTAAHAIDNRVDFDNPNIVKVVLDAAGRALYFSRATIPWPRDGDPFGGAARPGGAPLRHVGLYAYRAAFLRRFPQLTVSPLEEVERLEQLRVLWHGERIAVHVSDATPAIGIDTAEDLARAQALFDTRPGAGFA